MIGLKMEASVSAFDPGSDDLILNWSGGESRIFFNDGSGPDPPRSPWGYYPFIVNTVMSLTYCGGGVLTLMASDDDGGRSQIDIEIL